MKARRQISPLLSSRKDVPGNEGLMSNQQFNQALIVQEPMNQFANFIQEADSIFQRTSSISHDSHSEHKNLAALCLEVAENSSKYQRPALPQSFSTRKKKDEDGDDFALVDFEFDEDDFEEGDEDEDEQAEQQEQEQQEQKNQQQQDQKDSKDQEEEEEQEQKPYNRTRTSAIFPLPLPFKNGFGEGEEGGEQAEKGKGKANSDRSQHTTIPLPTHGFGEWGEGGGAGRGKGSEKRFRIGEKSHLLSSSYGSSSSSPALTTCSPPTSPLRSSTDSTSPHALPSHSPSKKSPSPSHSPPSTSPSHSSRTDTTSPSLGRSVSPSPLSRPSSPLFRTTSPTRFRVPSPSFFGGGGKGARNPSNSLSTVDKTSTTPSLSSTKSRARQRRRKNLSCMAKSTDGYISAIPTPFLLEDKEAKNQVPGMDEIGSFFSDIGKAHEQMGKAMKETHHCFKEQILRHISSANRAGEAYTKLVERRETLSQKKDDLEKKVMATPNKQKLTSRLLETEKILKMADSYVVESEIDVMKIMDAVDNAAKIMWFQSLCSLYNNYKTVVEEMGECLSRFSSFFDNLTEETEKERDEAVTGISQAMAAVPKVCERADSLVKKNIAQKSTATSFNLNQTEGGVGEEGEKKPIIHSVELLKVNKDHKTNKRVDVDVANGRLTFYHIKQQTNLLRNGVEITQIRRNIMRDKSLSIHWAKREHPENFVFHKKFDREYFFAAAHKARSLSIPPPKNISLYMTTWNMGNAPPPEDIISLLPPGHDIYAICAQEAEYPTTDPSYSSCENELFDHLRNTLGDDFVQLASTTLLYIRMVIFVSRRLYFHISNVQRSSVATGIGGVIGNKGGVGISFQICETRVCIVGSHLAAHQGKVASRNQNYAEIVKNLKLAPSGLDLLSYFHHVLWFGDLNYRINLSRDEVIAKIEQEDFASLRQYDQLLEERKAERVFFGFKEGTPNFRPTYRYERGSRIYSAEKLRIPSWCDRILWHSLPNSTVKLEDYGCRDDLMTSDHSPVFASLTIDTQVPYLQEKAKITPLILTLSDFAVKINDEKYNQKMELSFWAPFLVSSPSLLSSNASNGVITWDPTLVAQLSSVITDEEFLIKQCICVILSTKNNTNSLEGQGSFALTKDIFKCDSQDNFPAIEISFPFKSKEGMRAGEFSAKIQMKIGGKAGEEGKVKMKGYLLKKGGFVQSWKRRWFELSQDGTLTYFESQGGKPLGEFCIVGCLAQVMTSEQSERQNAFAVETKTRTWYYVADTSKELMDWVVAINSFTN